MNCRHQNGEIIVYQVRYGEERGDQTLRFASGDSSGGMTILTGLTKQTVYTVEVAARTSAGTGVYSQPQNIETLDSEQLAWFPHCVFINPRHAWVTVLSVCLSVCDYVFCNYVQREQNSDTNGFITTLASLEGDFRITTAFKSYGVKSK